MSPRGETHESLLRYLARPSKRRLARVVEEHHAHVWAVARQVTGNDEDAADACQEVFLDLLLHPPPASAVRSPRGYLAWRVVTRASRARRSSERRRGREVAFVQRARDEGIAGDDAEALRAAIAALPEELRVPVELRYLGGLRNQDVADTLGMPLRTLELRLEQAREHLRRRLTPLIFAALVASSGAAADARQPTPPRALRGELLRIASAGSALAVGGVGAAGGATSAKAALPLAAAVLIAIGGWSAHRWFAEPKPKPAPVVLVASLAKAGPGDTVPPTESAPTSQIDAAAAPVEPPRAGVRGRVLDEDGHPLAQARVSFRDNVKDEEAAALRALGYAGVEPGERSLDTTSDGEGEFEFSSLLPGDARARAELEGYFSNGWPDFELSAGSITVKDLTLKVPCRLRGTVTNGEGEPIPDATVLVRSFDVLHAEVRPRTGGMDHDYVLFPVGPDGRYDTGPCLRGPPAPGSTLAAWARGFAVSWKAERLADPSRREREVDFRLDPERALALRVADPRGRPVAGAEVGFGDATSTYGWVPYPHCITDEDGSVQVEHVPSSTRRLHLGKKGFRSRAIELEPEGPHEVSVTLECEAAPITARIVYDDAFPDGSRRSFYINLESETTEGSFRNHPAWFVNVDDTGLLQRATPRGPGRYRLTWSLAGETQATKPFDHASDGPTEIDIPVHLRPPWLKGLVTRAGSTEPVAGASVTAYHHAPGAEPSWWSNGTFIENMHFPSAPWPSVSCKTDAAGAFLVLLPRETGTVEVTVLAGEPMLGWSDEAAFTVERDSRIDDLRLVLEPSGALAGKVLEPDDIPSPGDLVVAYDCRGGLAWKLADAAGQFQLEGLRPGLYALESLGRVADLRIGSGGGSASCPGAVPTPELLFDRRVEVLPGKTTHRDIHLETERLGAIEGRLAEGLPGEGTVDVARVVDRGVCGGGDLDRDVPVHNGRFHAANLHRGEYRVAFSSGARDGPSAEAFASVARGQVAEVVLSAARGSAFVPLPEGKQAPAGIALASVERRDGRANGAEDWRRWGGASFEVAQGGFRIAGLPADEVRLRFTAAGLPEAWIESVDARAGIEVRTAALEFAPPRSARLRIEREDGRTLSDEIGISVFSSRGEVVCEKHRIPGEPAWLITPLTAGEFTIHASTNEGGGEARFQMPPAGDAEVKLVIAVR